MIIPSSPRVTGYDPLVSQTGMIKLHRSALYDYVNECHGALISTSGTNKRYLFEKKINDAEKGIIDALNIEQTGNFIVMGNNHRIGLRDKHSYARFKKHFNKQIIKEADYSLGEKNASFFLTSNQYAIDQLSVMQFKHNPPSTLEMELLGYFRKPEYKYQYSMLLNAVNTIRRNVSVRKYTSTEISAINNKITEYTRQAERLNSDQTLLLSVEERLRKYYVQCPADVVELAIHQCLYGILPVEC